MKKLRGDSELKDILVKRSGWKDFLMPVHKKVLPIIIPAVILGFVFYNIISFLIQKEVSDSFGNKLFLTAIVFLYIWFVLLLFVLSCLVYTIAESYQRGGSQKVMERLKFR